ncbi:MAG: TonB-dependent receptor [Desulfobulbaceae bacterium]|nr:TonB-dependent receptor [Desulfobulbaceae bacterium]HIJ91404.1 TonB-dependent receptor [Deltaproteobacteria bacterium]
MKYPYFFGSRTSSVSAFILFALLPGVSLGAEPNTAPAPMSMYFDDSQLVEVATRAPKPMRQVAENVSIVTAEEIEGMHARNLGEVLSRLPGVFVCNTPPDFNGGGFVYIQGSREEHVLVLIDGVRLNSAMSGFADVNHLPLRIIERIEIIKGPASAAWGSSQGGVINILTKKTGSTAKPVATVSGSFGERQVAEYEADLAGKVGKVGYYLYAGQQDSNGLMNDRYYDSGRAYGKVAIELPRNSTLTFTGNASDPHYLAGDFDYAAPYFSQDTIDRTYFLTANYDTPLTDSLHLNLGARQYARTFIDNRSILPGSPAGTPDELFYKSRWHEKGKGINAQLSWQNDWQQVSLGSEMNRSEMGTTTDYGPWAQTNWWAPAQDISKPGYEETWGIYLNDTMTFGKLTLTPGLRFDHHSISDSLFSPSLGATYRLREDTLLRAMASRGFQYPILSYITGGGIWDSPNPNLRPEIVTSWQMGVENRSLSFLSLKLNAFLHDIKEVWGLDWSSGTWGNVGKSQRQGFELEAATTPWHNLSLVANTTYALTKPDDGEKDATTAANLILRYQDQQGWRGELAGQYIWWDTMHVGGVGQNEKLVWNASLGRTVYSSSFLSCDLYGKVNNLFNGAQDNSIWYQSPDRWVLAGMKLTF